MEYIHYAAIDIGSNAVRLLIKRLDESSKDHFTKVVTLRIPLRLGQDTFTMGKISDKKAHALREVIRSFAIVVKLYEVKKSHFRACATAALREASNGENVVEMIRRTTDVKIDIIAGTEEAKIVCDSHIMNSRDDSPRNMAYVDVGGGSTEISLIHDGELVSTKSYAIGTVRILNDAVSKNVREEMWRDMELLTADYNTEATGIEIVGAGGNINKLFSIAGKYDSTNQTLEAETLRKIYNTMKPMSISERMEHFNLKQDRADVIVPAGEVFLLIADALKASKIEVPTTGLADGIIEELYRRQKESKVKRNLFSSLFFSLFY